MGWGVGLEYKKQTRLSWKYSQQGEGDKRTGCLPDPASPTPQAQQLRAPRDSAEPKEAFGVHADVMGWSSFKF